MKQVLAIMIAILTILTPQDLFSMTKNSPIKSRSERAQENLDAAVAFLKENSTKEGIQSLNEGKFQYKQVKKGDGQVCTEKTTPTLAYKGSLIDGSVFDQNEKISFGLNQVIPGFKLGLVGMQIGEIREVYIHPDLGYGPRGQSSIPGNALLIFTIELKGLK
jgi:peptidylprolyl isomerase